jgi:hypothetical protein
MVAASSNFTVPSNLILQNIAKTPTSVQNAKTDWLLEPPLKQLGDQTKVRVNYSDTQTQVLLTYSMEQSPS